MNSIPLNSCAARFWPMPSSAASPPLCSPSTTGALAPLLDLPEALLRDDLPVPDRLYRAGRLARHPPNHAESPGHDRMIAGKYRMDHLASIALLFSERVMTAEPASAKPSSSPRPSRPAFLRRAAIYRPAPERRHG